MAEDREVRQARAKAAREREGAYWGRVAEAGKAARQGRGEAEAERASAGKGGGEESEARKRAARQRQAMGG